MESNKSVEVVTRISRLEIPYLNSFINYYLNDLEVDRISFFIRYETDLKEVGDYLKGKNVDLKKIKLNFIPNGIDISYKTLTPLILEKTVGKYLLIVDCDEFLKFDNGKNINEFMLGFDKDYEQFRWKMFVVDEFVESKNEVVIEKFVEGHTGKYIVNRDVIEFLEEHFAQIKELGKPPELQFDESASVLHICLRGFEDALLKTLFQKFTFIDQTLKAIKYQNFEKVNSNLKKGLLPNRFQLMAFLKTQCKELLRKPFSIAIDKEYLRFLCKDISARLNIDKLINLYERNKNVIENDSCFNELYPKVSLKGSSFMLHQKCLEKRPNYFFVNEKQYAYVHIPRTAGHSVAYNFNVKLSYTKASELAETAFKFAFVRNPIRRFVSAYRHLRYCPLYQKEAVEDFNNLIAVTKDFNEFYDKFVGTDDTKLLLNSTFFRPQSDYLMKDGEIVVDYIGSYENLEEDILGLSANIGLESKDILEFNKTPRRKPWPMLTVAQKQRIREIYDFDFKMFSYGPYKNKKSKLAVTREMV